jgi:putative methyltransferase
METAQMLIDLASTIVGSSLSDAKSPGSKFAGAPDKQPKMGAKNQVYYAKLNSSCPPALIPMLTTMVNGALKSKSTLLKCAKEDGLFDLPASSLPPNCPRLDPTNPPPELIVVLYEALLGSRRVRGNSPIVQLIKARKVSLQQRLAFRRKRGVEHSFAARIKLPRFVRVNLLKTTVEKTKQHFIKSLGLKYKQPDRTTNVLSVRPGTFTMDPVLPDLFILPSGTNLHPDKQVDNGALVLQDRSSCITAIALSPPPNAVCIDTCASPGNKTLHMASLMRGKGKITAFERDLTRLGTLERRIVEQGAHGFVTARGADFMQADLSESGEFKTVTHILIDPSCSGSGLVAISENGASMASEYDNGSLTANSDKVAQLAKAQLELILFAMKLPNLQVVVYSTCSVYREENEDVVMGVLAKQNTFKCVEAIPKWPHRGLEGVPEFQKIASLVCRATYEKDSTNGFFVARFERITQGDGEDKEKKMMNKQKKRKNEALDEEEKAEPSSKKPKVEEWVAEKQEICKQYAKKGICKRGSKCRFSHVSAKPVERDDVDVLMAEWS